MAVSLEKRMSTAQVAQVWRARNLTHTRSLDVELVETERECYERLGYVKHADYPHTPGTLYDCPACEASGQLDPA